mgnify:CR=1 FL=1
MSDKLKALREKRGKIVADLKAITDKADTEKRDLTNEEAAKHAELFKVQDETRALITAEERTIELRREDAEAAADAEKRDKEAKDKGKGDETPEQRQMIGLRHFLRTGKVSGDQCAELRTLQAGLDTEGGFIRTPAQFIASLLKGVDNAVFIRRRATVITVTAAESLGVPTLDADVDDVDWTSELLTGTEDTAMRFGKREMRPHPMAKRIKISKKLLRVAALPIENLVRDRIQYKVGVTQEKAYLTGNGDQKPLGIYVASADGIPTSRDVSTGNTTTALTFDGLISAKYAVKQAYWSKCAWNFHRDAVQSISKLKDGEGRYLWRESVKAGEPDTILNAPVDMSEYTPSTFTTGQYVGMFGDFSHYWIMDSLDFQLQTLLELYAETNQVGFIGRYEGDGMPVLPEAFARVKLA